MVEVGAVQRRGSVFDGHNAVIVTGMSVEKFKVVKLDESFGRRFTWKEKGRVILGLVTTPPIFSIHSLSWLQSVHRDLK